ncbi:MAG: hypothetical protein WCW13_06090 [archaeon]
MGKALIVYYSLPDKKKTSNEDKAATEFEKLFNEKNISTTIIALSTEKKLSLGDQFKKEKELTINQKIPDLTEFDYVFIGSPVVGSLTSAPLVNVFIRSIQKVTQNQAKPIFALFVTGIISGFALKKMQSLLSMKGIKPTQTEAFTSMFEFDSKKIAEIKKFFDKVMNENK